MARTRASVAAKVVTGKSSKARCSAPPPSSSTNSTGASGEKSSRSYSGGNSVCPRETPKWQKPITNFFIQNQTAKSVEDTEDAAQAGSSKSKPKPKHNVIHSDDEADPSENTTDLPINKELDETINTTDLPINKELDETIELEPLTGEDSHKMDEYYSTKDKGRGKKSNKENRDTNVTRNKRHLDELNSDDERTNKKIKLD